MNFFAALNALFLLISPTNATEEDAKVTPVDFRVRTYTYGTYYAEPYTCPHGYTYGPGYSYHRGFRIYAPGYFGAYRYGCYDERGRLYRPRAYYYPRYRYYRY